MSEKLDEKGIELKPKQVEYLNACVNAELERVESDMNEYIVDEEAREMLAKTLQEQLNDEKRSILSLQDN